MVRSGFIFLWLIFGLLVGRSAESWQAEIRAQSSSNLVTWLDLIDLPPDLRDYDTMPYPICDELVRRHQIAFLIGQFATRTNEQIETYLAGSVLGQIRDKRIERAFRQRLSENEDEESYYIAEYLGGCGDTKALAVLNRHYFEYPISSARLSWTASLFGKYKYRPAVSNLIESLDAASFNLSGPACLALQKIFPDSPTEFKGPKEAKDYYTKRIQKQTANCSP